jgi:hypothetical protein
MRTTKISALAFALAGLASALGPWAPRSVAGDAAVAIQYHFAGAANLSNNTNFVLAKRLLSLTSSVDFENLALDRLAGIFWRGLHFRPGPDPAASLRPLLDDLLANESVASFGGENKDHLDFVLAARLDQSRAQAWQQCLALALGGAGAPFTFEGFSGARWNPSGQLVYWIIQARDWVVVGQGDDLQPVVTDYLRQIQKDGRPSPALDETWFQTEVDWARLAGWVPLDSSPFNLARTAFKVAVSGGRFRVTGTVTYPEAQPWVAVPWHFPKDLVHEPLLSFTAGRDLAPFLKPAASLPHIFAPAFTNQFCCWAQHEMPLQSYAAWPVPDGRQALDKIRMDCLPRLNFLLTQPDDPKLAWAPKTSEIIWSKSSIIAPSLSSTRAGRDGDYLVAKLFPASESKQAAPKGLWSQFEHGDNLVYYDWEFTGPRLQQWRLLCELLPVLPPASVIAPPPAGHGPAPRQPFAIVDGWLAGLTPYLGNTVTEIKQTAPNELSFNRVTPFVLTGFELLWLSHWLSDTPSGPINFGLLPVAKMSGPGIPH